VFDTNGTLLRHICGYLQQDLILFTTGNTAHVSFFSDGVITNVGFLASWVAVPIEEETEVEEEEEEEVSETRKESYLLAFPQVSVISASAWSCSGCSLCPPCPRSGTLNSLKGS
jgi:hypothetical protein